MTNNEQVPEMSSHSRWVDSFSSLSKHEALCICPGLAIEAHGDDPNIFLFGPFALVRLAFASSRDEYARRWEPLVKEYENKRGGAGDSTVVVYLKKDCVSVGHSLWPVMILAFTGWARAECSGPGGMGYIPSPEAFFTPAVTPHLEGYAYCSGLERGYGEAHHVPLRWDVEQIHIVDRARYNRSLAHACDVISRKPHKFKDSKSLRLIGVASDLANASIGYEVHKIQNISQVTRMYALLLSAFEALCRLHKDKHNHSNWVAKKFGNRAVSQHEELTSKSWEREAFGDGKLVNGTDACLIEYVIRRLTDDRNFLAHGKDPLGWEGRLPKKVGGNLSVRVGKLLFDSLISQEMLSWLELPVCVGIGGGHRGSSIVEYSKSQDYPALVGACDDLGHLDDFLFASLGGRVQREGRVIGGFK